MRSTLARLDTSDLILVRSGKSEVCAHTSGSTDAKYFEHCVDLVIDELGRRAPVSELLRALDNGLISDGSASVAASALERIDSPEVEEGFLRLAQGGRNGPNYFALMHFAHRCQPWALAELSEHGNRFSVPSYVYVDAIDAIGQCRFVPATGMLVLSLNAASLNIVDAAMRSLEAMYRGGPRGVRGSEGVKAWHDWLVEHSAIPN